MRLTRKGRAKAQRKFLIFVIFFSLMILSVGYAAFTTNIRLNAKGNITQKPFGVSKLIEDVVVTGDGLYEDSLEQGRYIYKGANPDNYITLGNDLYRIISIESDNYIKVIRNTAIGSYPYDNNDRFSSVSTDYCGYTSSSEDYKGCNVWGSKTSMLDSSGNNITKMVRSMSDPTLYDLPTLESSLNVYLNGEWFNSLSYKSKIQEHLFNVGILFDSNDLMTSEKNYKWRGFVAIINGSDFINSNSDLVNCSTRTLTNTNSSLCKDTTWLTNSENYNHTLGIFYNSNTSQIVGPDLVLYFGGAGSSYGAYSIYSRYVRPVFHLSPDTRLKGYGTQESPYYLAD